MCQRGFRARFPSKRTFRASLPSKSESSRCENKLRRKLPSKTGNFKLARRRLECGGDWAAAWSAPSRTRLAHWTRHAARQASPSIFRGTFSAAKHSILCIRYPLSLTTHFVRGFPQRAKVEDVKTRLACETWLMTRLACETWLPSKWKVKLWKRSFRARPSPKTERWTFFCEASLLCDSFAVRLLLLWDFFAVRLLCCEASLLWGFAVRLLCCVTSWLWDFFAVWLLCCCCGTSLLLLWDFFAVRLLCCKISLLWNSVTRKQRLLNFVWWCKKLTIVIVDEDTEGVLKSSCFHIASTCDHLLSPGL